MKSLIQKMLVSTAIALVALASAGHAMAANPHHKANLHHTAKAAAVQEPHHYQAPLDVAAIPPYPNYSSNASPAPYSRAGYDIAARPAYSQWGYGPQWGYGYPAAAPGIDVGRLIASVLGGAVPLHYGGKATASDSGSYDYSLPAYDNSPAVDTSSAADDALAASEEENQIIQENNDTMAQTASMAAAEEENDEANAATLQTEINAGM
jgi:hypothetical protein